MSAPFLREHREDRGPHSHYHAAIQAWHDEQEHDRLIRERMRAANPRRRPGLAIVLWLIVIVIVTAVSVSCTRPDEMTVAGAAVAQAAYSPRPLTHWEAYERVRSGP